MIWVYIVIIVLIVLGIPCVLMGMLLWHGLRLDWQDLTRGRVKRQRRGFEVMRKPEEPKDPKDG